MPSLSPLSTGLFETHVQRARSYLAEGKADLAEQNLAEAYLLKPRDVTVLSLLGEHDTVAKASDVRDGLTRLPASAKLVTIKGSVHAFFGRYGPQKGDGVPTVSRADAEAQIVRAVLTFLRDE